jgi:hypothetical protein
MSKDKKTIGKFASQMTAYRFVQEQLANEQAALLLNTLAKLGTETGYKVLFAFIRASHTPLTLEYISDKDADNAKGNLVSSVTDPATPNSEVEFLRALCKASGSGWEMAFTAAIAERDKAIEKAKAANGETQAAK